MDHEKICSCLAEALEKSVDEIRQLSSTAKLSDVDMNSIKFIKFIVIVEEQFNIVIDDSDLLMTNYETKEMTYETLSKYLEIDHGNKDSTQV